MNTVTHHLPDWMIRAYVAGRLGRAFSLVVAAHVTLCDECRAQMEGEEASGGIVFEDQRPEAVATDLKSRVMASLDTVPAPPAQPTQQGIYPGAVMAALKGRPPRWRTLGGGIRQAVLSHDAEGSVRLLYIPGRVAVPDHGHKGLELTLVLQGSFADETGRFAVGDVEVAGAELEHQPIAEQGAPCICLAATDAPLRFSSFVPRLLQPIFRI